MGAAKKLELVSVEEYLSRELRSDVKHEYLGGVIHAMADVSNSQSIIAGNILGTLQTQLRGKPCRAFSSNTKVRVRLPTQTRFYYPDASVVRHQNGPHDYHQDAPVVIVEVLSRSTRRTDTGEKKDAYLTIPTLSVYLLVEHEEPAIVAYRRTNDGFVREIYEGHDAVIPLPEIGVELALADIYDDVEFSPEPDPHELAAVDG